MGTRGSFLVGLIGSGIGPSLSPQLHEKEGERLHLHYRYRRWDLDVLGKPAEAVGELLDAARLAGYDGMNVTHPCKQQVLSFLDELSPDARALGAVNTVVFSGGRAFGHNTDWSGFARSFRRGLPNARLHHVVLFGAGGAGAAVAHAMLALGAGVLEILDLDWNRSTALAASLRDRFGVDRAVATPSGDRAEAIGRATGLVHATPTGMAAHPGMPVPADLLRPENWVAEVVYRPLGTELVATARERGCQVLDGGGMAVFQAADAFRLFTGIEPDAERMLSHFRELVDGRGLHAHR